jgi:uroporphyrinogen decarboxylase
MDARENMIRAIEFRTPERLPVQYGAFGNNDSHYVAWNQTGTGDLSLRETYDEWGCLWVRTEQSNMGQVKGHPLSDWDALDKYKWPDAADSRFYDGMQARFEGSSGKYVQTGIFMLLFERMHSLRGFENILVDLYLEQERAEMLADRIVEFNLQIIENISSRFPKQIDGFYFTEDWGTELSTFISPQLWSDFFKPRYSKIFQACKKAGWHIWMHSCGKINDIIPGIIEIGADVLNIEQPRVLGIEEVGSKYAGKICFSSGCDIQRTLPFKGEKDIREEAQLLLNCWGTEKGGFILSDDGNDSSLGIPKEKKELSYKAFLELDPWRRK